MAWYTDSAVLTTFPTAQGLTTTELTQALQDVVTVYDYTQANPGVTDSDLRAWGEGQSIDPDRMNRALGLLQDSGKLLSLPDPGPLAPTPVSASGADLVDLFTVPELRKAATRAGVQVPKSASKDELAKAIAQRSPQKGQPSS